MSNEDTKSPTVNTSHPLLSRFSNDHFNPKNYVGEIVSHTDTKGLMATLEQLGESKKAINEIMGDMVFKKYESIMKIDEHMNEIQNKADNLKDFLAEYQIAMQALQVNISDDVAMARKVKAEDGEEDFKDEVAESRGILSTKYRINK
eukprot:TRINITY_DN7541_c0_g1_i2.p1 TRINITY_DN7541_c0_g1~~TRINITY_DN7541_c0_g1_i2.p1  ORF type:complete len:147 (-),score=51.81 TRINITY_DN7541_c0_g1_i2:869-1309(-)